MSRDKETKRSDGDKAFEYWLVHRDEPGFSCKPEHDQTQVFGQKLKERIAQVMQKKGIQ